MQTVRTHSHFSHSPRCSTQSSDPRLQHAFEESPRIFASDGKVDDGQGDDTVDEQANDDGQHVQPQLLGGQGQIGDGHDLAHNQGHDAEWGVPVRH